MEVGVGDGKDNGRLGLVVGAVEAPALAARAAFSAFAKTILLEESITDPTSRQTKEQRLKPHQTKHKALVKHANHRMPIPLSMQLATRHAGK